MAKIFSLYRTILYSLIVIYLLVAIAPMAISYQPYIVLSASMEPTIETGSLCYINKKDKDVGVDDIVAYTIDEITVVHRIVDVNEKGNFVTKGDNNDSTDFATVNPDQIIGQVGWSVPKLGYFTSWLREKKGIIVAVSLVAVAFISSFITDQTDDPNPINGPDESIDDKNKKVKKIKKSSVEDVQEKE